LKVHRGEIVALLFAKDAPRTPLLRALAGRDRPRSGVVRFAEALHIALVSPESARAEAFVTRPDVVVLDGLGEVHDNVTERDAWIRLAAERERGTAIVLATTVVEHAYRGDRVTLAMWTAEDFTRELLRLSARMQQLVDEALELLGTPCPSSERWDRVRELERLTRASCDLLHQARFQAKTKQEQKRLSDVA
jgi:hypothetical protein